MASRAMLLYSAGQQAISRSPLHTLQVQTSATRKRLQPTCCDLVVLHCWLAGQNPQKLKSFLRRASSPLLGSVPDARN